MNHLVVIEGSLRSRACVIIVPCPGLCSARFPLESLSSEGPQRSAAGYGCVSTIAQLACPVHTRTEPRPWIRDTSSRQLLSCSLQYKSPKGTRPGRVLPSLPSCHWLPRWVGLSLHGGGAQHCKPHRPDMSRRGRGEVQPEIGSTSVRSAGAKGHVTSDILRTTRPCRRGLLASP